MSLEVFRDSDESRELLSLICYELESDRFRSRRTIFCYDSLDSESCRDERSETIEKEWLELEYAPESLFLTI